MGNEVVLKKKAQATTPYWNRARPTPEGGMRFSYVGKYRYPSYIGKDILTRTANTVGERVSDSGKIVYPPTMNGSSYLHNKKTEVERQALFIKKKTPVFYPGRRKFLHMPYSVVEKQVCAYNESACFPGH